MGRKQVLLIDDYVAFAESLRIALMDVHDVVVAFSGQEALQVLRTRHFDILICDLMMPMLSGVELYRRVAREWPGLEMQIIFITGGSFTLEASQFLDEISNPRLEKPFPVDRLRKLLDTLPVRG